MRAWNRSTAAGNGDRSKKWRPGLSRSMRQAPASPARALRRIVGGATAATTAATPSPTVPSTRAALRNSGPSTSSPPKCGAMSISTWDATPATNAGTGRRTTAPIAAPASAWLVTNTSGRYCRSAGAGRSPLLGGPAGCDPGRLVGHLGVDGRPWRVHQPVGHVALRHGEERLDRLRLVADGGPRVAAPGDPPRHRRQGQVVGVGVAQLVPRQRRRHLAADPRPHGPGAEDGLVRGVLVVVDEDPLAPLLLPPRGGDDVGVAALELAGGCHGGRPHLVRVPARLEAGVHVAAPVAGGLGERGDAQLGKER